MSKKSILNLAVIGLVLTGSAVMAKTIPAELVMGNGKAWKGEIVKRDGEWIEFKTKSSPRPIRIGSSTIKELNFSVNIDAEKLSEMMANREYETIIAALSKAIKPFAEYSDIPSNLTKYNTVLMELYYRTQQYDESLAISTKISADDRDPELQEKSRMYQALALIDSGNADEAQAMLSKYGWDQDLTDEAAPDKLYITAKLMALNKQYNKAMELVAKVIAFNSQDPDWMQPAELLCAEVYTELGMLDSAEEVCRQILMLYKNTPEFDKAERLKIKIEKLRAEQKLEESLKAEEA
jgi:tetratricopeptide (TPR) repeat protein